MTKDILLDDSLTIAELEALIWAIPYKAGATDMATAFLAVTEMFEDLGKSDTPKLAYVITDGVSTIFTVFTKNAADIAKTNGITVFAVGK